MNKFKHRELRILRVENGFIVCRENSQFVRHEWVAHKTEELAFLIKDLMEEKEEEKK